MRNHRIRICTPVAIAAAFLLAIGAIADEGEHEGGEVMLVAGVVPGSAAESAGLAVGDRIVTWDGQKITTQQELSDFLDSYRPGDEIPLTLSRGGRTLKLPLTFGERADGGVSLGLSLGVADLRAPEVDSEGFSAAECLVWLDERYRMAAMAEGFGLDLSAEIEENRACMEHDTQRMALPIPQTWCDNVFKIHCSGLDLLAEIGDAQVVNCELDLSAAFGVDIRRNKTWNTCAEQRVFDRYSMRGEASDEATCRRILIDECGAAIAD